MRFFSFLLILYSSIALSQISISDLKKAGINSENDLKRLGVSTDEISAFKQEYLNSRENDSEKKDSLENSELLSPTNKEKTTVLISEKENSYPEKIYGQSIFTTGAVSIQNNSDRIKANDNYTIGSGDRISVTIWGFSEFSEDFTVDELGNIKAKLVGRINLKGRSFKDAKSIIKSKFSRVYDLNNFQIGIELSYSKVISVNIMGEVLSPGTFSVPSINSAFNLLSLAKGINNNGSVRNISIVRNGKIINTLDVYYFMNNSQKSSTVHLMDGDFIIVPTHGNLISINGEVIRNGDFEIKENETLFDLIEFAGGFNPNANFKSISIIRSTPQGKILKSFSYKESKDITLKNGDSVIVAKTSEIIKNKITVRGEVNGPGIYEFIKDETLEKLIFRANGFTRLANLNIGHIYRLNNNQETEIIQIDLSNLENIKNIKLKDLDEVLIFSKKTSLDTNYVTINGLVRNPKRFVFKTNMNLRDLLTLSGGNYPQADLSRIEIERIDFSVPKNDTMNYVKIMTKDFKKNADFKIEPFDIINIRALPEFKFQETIELRGEVKYPGAYSLAGNRVRISDVIERAGGLTAFAYGAKAYINRKEDSLGIILLDLDLVIKNKNSNFNYIMRPGDIIFIPRSNDIVSISGAIGSKFVNKEVNINVPFRKGKRASFYIKKYAGGYDVKAKKKSIYAITLNRQVKKTKFFGFVKPKIEKGDKIIVNLKPTKTKNQKVEKINWNNQIENFTVKITGLATLWILIASTTN